jgi:hypothetical protein
VQPPNQSLATRCYGASLPWDPYREMGGGGGRVTARRGNERGAVSPSSPAPRPTRSAAAAAAPRRGVETRTDTATLGAVAEEALRFTQAAMHGGREGARREAVGAAEQEEESAVEAATAATLEAERGEVERLKVCAARGKAAVSSCVL